MSNVLHKFSKLTNFSTTLLCKHGHTNLCHDKYTGGGASYSVVKLSHALKTNGTMPGIESYNIPVNKVEKFHKWATYTLIDVKLVVIMAYVYVSVVNLISTTATNEANDDTENSAPVNISARQGHTNVIVTYIDDSILWNCREYSPSDRALNLTALLGVRLHSSSEASTFIKHAHTKNVPLGSKCMKCRNILA